MWVAVREADFTDGRLPSVCVRTGDRADRVLGMTLRSLPRWTYLLLLFGVLPRTRAAALALFAAGAVLTVAGSRVGALAVAGLLAVVASLGVLLVRVPQLGIRGAIVVDEVYPGRCIVLSGVHPAFRRAVEEMGRALGSGE